MVPVGSGLGFSIYKRKGSKKLQMQFRDNNRFAIQKSSGTTNRLEATRLAIEWKEKGLPQENGKPPRPVAEQIAAEALIYSVSTAKLTEDDAKRIVDILSARGLVKVHAGLLGL